MKKIFAGLLTAGFLFACGGSNDEKAGNSSNTANAANEAAEDKALDLITKKYDCATCHKIEEKIQGPSYRDVANKYGGQPDAVKYLTEKVIKGGSGVWGDIPMAAHPTMTQEDAETIVKYILSLKK